MSRFYFDVTVDGQILVHAEGLDLPSLDAARKKSADDCRRDGEGGRRLPEGHRHRGSGWKRPATQKAAISPMAAFAPLSPPVPTGDGWIHELNDGYRILALKDGDTVRLWSRHGRDWSAEFLSIVAAVRALPVKRIMIDGEAVAHCPEGLPDFYGLMGEDGQAAACFYAFDMLFLGSDDLRGLELIARRRMLRKALRKAGEALRFSEHMEAADGPAMYRHACAMGLEGIVSKRIESRYRSGRCRS